MTSDEERMAELAGRPLDALDDDEREQVASWTRLLADDDDVGRAGRGPGGPGGGLDPGRAEAGPPLGHLGPDHQLLGAPAAGRAGRGRRHHRARCSSSAATTGRTSFASGELTGTDLASGASGKVVIYQDTAGFRVELKAHDLPPLDERPLLPGLAQGAEGIGPGRHVQPRATATGSRSGPACRPTDYPTLTVTIEAPDGNQDSSGQKVLTGQMSP